MTSPVHANSVDTPLGRMFRRGRGLAAAGTIVLGATLQGPAATARSAVVAAAADLKFALDDVASRFNAGRRDQIEIAYGSSGLLARQIQDGAPFELFLSADEAFVSQLADAGLTRDRGVLYAVGRLAVFAPEGSALVPDPELRGLRALIEQHAVTKFAIANPAYAPYGRAAEAVLRKRGLWGPLQPSLVLGDNVAQAAQFASTGNAVGGLVAHSLVLAPPLRDRGRYALIPEADHPPLRQRMVLLKRAGSAAEAFYKYLQTGEARKTLNRFGFALPPG